MSDSSVSCGGGHERILFSEDLEAIGDYLQNSGSPMVNLSPSWFCRGGSESASGVDVFSLPTAVSNSPLINNSFATPIGNMKLPSNVTLHRTITSVVSSHSPTIDMASGIGSSLHGREVCAALFSLV